MRSREGGWEGTEGAEEVQGRQSWEGEGDVVTGGKDSVMGVFCEKWWEERRWLHAEVKGDVGRQRDEGKGRAQFEFSAEDD